MASMPSAIYIAPVDIKENDSVVIDLEENWNSPRRVISITRGKKIIYQRPEVAGVLLDIDLTSFKFMGYTIDELKEIINYAISRGYKGH